MAKSDGKQTPQSGGPKPSAKNVSSSAVSSKGMDLTSLAVAIIVVALGFLSIDLYQRHHEIAPPNAPTQAKILPNNDKVIPQQSPNKAVAPKSENNPAEARPVKNGKAAQTANAKSAAPGTALVKPAALDASGPRFDIVRVEPDGTAVIAGRAAPGSEVDVMSGKTSIGKVKTNARGEWALVLKKPLRPGAHDLSIIAVNPDSKARQRSQQKVAVAVPQRSGVKPLVVLSDKGKPSRVLQSPEPGKQKAITPGKLALKVVDYDTNGSIIFTGTASPGATARIYVDNRFLQDAAVDGAGIWELRASTKITPGDHALRVDELDKVGKVIGRIELPFTRARPSDVLALQKARKALPAKPRMQVAARSTTPSAPAAKMPQKTAPATTTRPPAPVVEAPRKSAPAAATPKKTAPAAEAPKKSAPVAATPKKSAPVAATPEKSVPVAEAPQQTAPAKSEKTMTKQTNEVAQARVPSVVPKQMTAAPAISQPPVKIEKPAPRAPEQQMASVRDPAGKTPEIAADKPAPTAPDPQMQAATQPAPAPQEPGGIIVQPGNNLWNISRVIYGHGVQYTVIYQANSDQIRDPDLIFPGQIFKTPGVNPPRVIPPGRRTPLTK